MCDIQPEKWFFYRSGSLMRNCKLEFVLLAYSLLGVEMILIPIVLSCFVQLTGERSALHIPCSNGRVS
jgi:hypothetical protein